MATKTPEEIEAMEAEVQAYRQQQAREQAEALREAATPLIEVVESDAFSELQGKLGELRALSVAQPGLTNLGTHLNALEHGLNGLKLVAQGVPAVMPEAPAP